LKFAVPTAIYYPFAMYSRMQSLLLKSEASSPTFDSQAPGNIEAFKYVCWLDATATAYPDRRRIAISLINRNPSRSTAVRVNIRNLKAGAVPVRMSLLTGNGPEDENTFENPRATKIVEKILIPRKNRFTVTIPACSVAVPD
jgi:alpha-L-arabinofuranosidase